MFWNPSSSTIFFRSFLVINRNKQSQPRLMQKQRAFHVCCNARSISNSITFALYANRQEKLSEPHWRVYYSKTSTKSEPKPQNWFWMLIEMLSYVYSIMITELQTQYATRKTSAENLWFFNITTSPLKKNTERFVDKMDSRYVWNASVSKIPARCYPSTCPSSFHHHCLGVK